VSTLEFVKAFGARYGFSKFPQTLEDIDPQKGIEFRSGKLKERNIDLVTIFSDGVVVDTKSSTDDSDFVLEDGLKWASGFSGLSSPLEIGRRTYWSQISFMSEINLPGLHPIFGKIGDQITEIVSRNLKQTFRYELTAITMNFDHMVSKFASSAFTVERYPDVPFSEKKYVSHAPVSTSEHISILEEFESSIGH